MARKYKNKTYRGFVPRGIRALPAGIAQPLMRPTTVLELQKKSLFHSPELVPIGTLISLCEGDTLREKLKKELSPANMDAFKEPFSKKEELKVYEGMWDTKQGGMLGFGMPNVASLGAWVGSHLQCKCVLHGVTSHVLNDDYLSDLFRSRKWKPCITSKNYYVLNEVVLATKVSIRLSNAVDTGISASLDPLAGIHCPAGVSVAVAANDTLEIEGATVNGIVQPFPVAYRCVRVVFNEDFTVRKMEWGRGGQDPKMMGV